MVFSSLLFLCRFLPAFAGIYLLTPTRFRNVTLFVGSLVFYAWGEPVYILLMLFSTVLDYGNGNVIQRLQSQGRRRMAKAVLAESVLANLSMLGIFKYSGALPLPIGISFYTFQTMSYTIDVYRREVEAQKDFVAFGAYVSMFPQLIAGPIVKYKDVAAELSNRMLSLENVEEGARRFLIGLGKKVLVANQLGLLFAAAQELPTEQMSVLSAWLGSVAYALQLYFDFSGYSDMAIGLGRMMGFHLKENFNYPYASASVTEFWRRWHISLGQWFREYVYIPLGGNRRGLAIQLRNILIVWGLTGIWHGKGWNFLVWGLYFGVLLILEKSFLLKSLRTFPRQAGHLYTVFCVLIGMTVFALENLQTGLRWITMLFGSTGVFANGAALWLLVNYGFLVVLAGCGAMGLFRRAKDSAAVCIGTLVLSLAYLVNAGYNPFLYFRF